MSLEFSPIRASDGARSSEGGRSRDDDDDLITDHELERWIGAARGFAAKDRLKPKPVFQVIRFGRMCRYRRGDIRKCIAELRDSQAV